MNWYTEYFWPLWPIAIGYFLERKERRLHYLLWLCFCALFVLEMERLPPLGGGGLLGRRSHRPCTLCIMVGLFGMFFVLLIL